MWKKESARRCGNSTRARGVHFEKRDMRIVAQSEWDSAMRLLPLVFGACFALMCAWTIVIGG